MVAHHHGKAAGGGGVSIKGSDLRTVPLCDAHHTEFHKTGKVYPFESGDTELLFLSAMVESLAAALLSGLKL